MIAHSKTLFRRRNGGTHHCTGCACSRPRQFDSGRLWLGWNPAMTGRLHPYADIPGLRADLRVTANAKIVADDYPYHIRRDWSALYRTT